MNPLDFLNADDPVTRLSLQAVAQRVFEIRAEANKG